jgi:tetratricopeptide (TPR) repeat protein
MTNLNREVDLWTATADRNYAGAHRQPLAATARAARRRRRRGILNAMAPARWLAIGALLAGLARGNAEDLRAEARRLYGEGRSAYLQADYARAVQDFQRGYALTGAPAFEYNLASALAGLGRFREAAAALRAFVTASPRDPERPAIEARIRALEESERLPASASVRLQAPERVKMRDPPEVAAQARRQRRTIVALVVVAVVVVAAAAVAIGLVFTPALADPTPSALGAHAGTR